jgi:hypothetical protein
MHAVEADRLTVSFDLARRKSEIITLKNTLPGPVSMRSFTDSPGLKVEFAKTNLAANESTTLTLTPIAEATDRPAAVLINVQPMNQIISIAINWAN